MEVLYQNLLTVELGQVIMWLIGGVLIYLAIAKQMEPTLLLPMGFGAILVNLPNSGAAAVIGHLFDIGIAGHELFPLLLFIGIGAMIDFQPLLTNPKLMIFGAAAQFGIFFTLGLASLCGFECKDAASIAIIGAADGPTSIFVATMLDSSYLSAIMVAAYSYMALVPIIQPPVIKLCTTQAERRIKMPYTGKPVAKTTKILFPILVTVVVGLVAPDAVALIGFLMFGNLIRECGVLNSLSETAQTVLANLITILLGISIASRMTAEEFLRAEGEKQGIGTAQSHERYDILTNLLAQTPQMDETAVRDALDSVSKDNFEEFTSTEWSIVMNLSAGEARYYHREDYTRDYTFRLQS